MKLVIIEKNNKTVREVIAGLKVRMSNGIQVRGEGFSMSRINRPYHLFPDDFEVEEGDELSAEDKEFCMRDEIDNVEREEDLTQSQLLQRIKELEKGLAERE